MIVTFLTLLIVVSLLIFINALYVSGEFATVSARKTRIIQMADSGNRLAKMLLPVLEDRHKLDSYIAASQVGITISSIVLGIYGENQIAPRITPWIAKLPLGFDATGGSHVAAAGIAATLVLMVLTTLQVIAGELIPKSIAIQYPERLALVTSIPMKISAEYLLRPLIAILNGSGMLILRLLGISGSQEHEHVHSPEEILILVRDSHRGGLIDSEDTRFLQSVFRSNETQAVEIAVPRTRMVAAAVNRPVSEVLELAAESAYSRIPVYEEGIDQIVGFVHLRDLFALYRSSPEANLKSIVRHVPFVPETLTTAEVWNRLNEAQSYLAIVFDEFGGTSGLITREDLIEELFGELQDEFDHEHAPIVSAGRGKYTVLGSVAITELNALLEIDLPHEEAHTIGGLIMDELDRIPQVGDEIEVQGIHFRVQTVEQRSVGEVTIILPSNGYERSEEER